MLTHIITEKVEILKNHDSGNTFINRGYRCECGARHFERTGVSVNMGPTRPPVEWTLTCVCCGKKETVSEPWDYKVEDWGGQE
jgi:hypothetical protein